MKEQAFNENEAIILMYENTYESLKKIIEFIKKHNLNTKQIIKLLQESSDQLEAQSKVVEIREDLRTGKL